MKKYMGIKQVAELLGISEQCVRRNMLHLPSCRKIGRIYRFDMEQLEKDIIDPKLSLQPDPESQSDEVDLSRFQSPLAKSG